MRHERAVALGGGHGLAVSLAALKHITDTITAVVTVADDGGSSGRLREEFHVLPPGDLRMAISALCEDSDWGHQWRDVLQHRFGGEGPLAGHALGNLLIVALWDLLDGTVSGLDLVGRLLNARGKVMPMAGEPLEIVADILGHDPHHPDVLTTVRGQHAVAISPGRVSAVRLLPPDPAPCPEALAAVADADWVFIGPGSWFTSVLPHLLVPPLRQALNDTPARKVLNLNLDVGADETQGFRAADLLRTLATYAPELRLEAVVADPSVVESLRELDEAAEAFGAELVVQQVAAPRTVGQHDSLRLAAVYRDLMARRA